MRSISKGGALKILGVITCVLPPLSATLLQFPIWIHRGTEATMSGTFVLLAFFSILPLIKYAKMLLKAPAIPLFWWLAFAMFMVLRSIIDEMIIVFLVGGISNLIGVALFCYGKRLCEK